jgi:hypothetical protein
VERLQQAAAQQEGAPEVLVMEGGFTRFSEVYGSDATLVAKPPTQ